MRLLLIRHGQSTWNASGRWQGQADPPLTELGIRQAGIAASALGLPDAIFASTLERAAHTAESIASELGVGPVVRVEGLRERNAGEWQGMTRAEIENQYPGFLAKHRRPPGWEADESVLDRVLPALHEIGSVWPDGDVIVVTHGGVIYQVEQSLGIPFERIANLGARWLNYDGSTFSLGERIDLLEGKNVTIPDQI